jgi:hypothetical protein
MNQKHLTQVWQWMSVACVLFLLTSIVSIQGGSDFVGKLLGDKGGTLPDNKPAIGYFGTIIGRGLFLTASFALFLHAFRGGDHWHNRVPVVWLEGLNTSVWDGKLFQIVVLVLFLGLPAAGIIRCIGEAESGDVCELDANHFYKGSETTLLSPPHALEGHQMRLRREVSIRCGPRGARLRSERESSARRAGEFDNGTAEGPHRRFLSAVKMSAGETRQPCQATRSIRVGCGQFHGSSAARSLIL